jgi:hypothetical protein
MEAKVVPFGYVAGFWDFYKYVVSAEIKVLNIATLFFHNPSFKTLFRLSF